MSLFDKKGSGLVNVVVDGTRSGASYTVEELEAIGGGDVEAGKQLVKNALIVGDVSSSTEVGAGKERPYGKLLLPVNEPTLVLKEPKLFVTQFNKAARGGK